jgi:hypothetical protein
LEKREVTMPELAIIVGTDKLNKDQRKAVGWTLVFVGAITTIPLAIGLFCKNKSFRLE